MDFPGSRHLVSSVQVFFLRISLGAPPSFRDLFWNCRRGYFWNSFREILRFFQWFLYNFIKDFFWIFFCPGFRDFSVILSLIYALIHLGIFSDLPLRISPEIPSRIYFQASFRNSSQESFIATSWDFVIYFYRFFLISLKI